MGHDLLFALRSLRKNPGFSLTVVITLMLGVGANTAIFAVLHSVVLQSLPYPHSDRLVRLYEYDGDRDFKVGVSIPNFLDWQERATSFDLMEAFRLSFRALDEDSENRVAILAATPRLLELIGARPVLGRLVRPDDMTADAPAVAVLSHQLWVGRFGSDPDVVGQTFRLGGDPVTVIGVAEPIQGPLLSRTRVVVPWTAASDTRAGSRGDRGAPVLARLKEGVSLDQAKAEMELIGNALREQYPQANRRFMPLAVSLYEETVEGIRPTLLALFGATVLILLIAVANMANLFLSRGVSRRGELTVRTALGASSGRLIRLLLTESMLLAVAGGAAGIVVGWGLVQWLLATSPNWIPRLLEIGVDPTVFVLALAVTLATGLLLGLAPLAAVKRNVLRSGIQLAGHGQGQSLDRNRLRSALVVSQIALSLVLLTGAGLMIRSFIALQNVPLGVDFEGIVTFSTGGFRVGGFSEAVARRLERDRRIVDTLETIPGVIDATRTSQAPLSGGWGANQIEVLTGKTAGRRPQVDLIGVSTDFFPFFSVHVDEGRLFDPADQSRADDVVVVDANLAALIWEGESALGQRIRLGSTESEVIGVSEPIRYGDLAAEMRPKLYTLMNRSNGASGSTFLIRHEGDAEPVMAAIRTRVGEIDSSIRLTNLQPLEAIYDRYLRQPRFYLTLVVLLGAVALAVTAVGVFGVVAYSVSRRTNEVGIRMALGANSASIVGMFLHRTTAFLAAGLAIGAVASLWLTRYLDSLLFEIEPTDPLALISMAAVLACIALLATLVPTRRAFSIDPAQTLRSE